MERKKSGEARDLIDEWEPDLIYTTDDDAQEYVAKYYINKDTPFVFSGVNKDPEQYGFAGSRNITGVMEHELFSESDRLLKNIIPNVKRIAVVFDDASLWFPVMKRMKEESTRLQDVSFVSWDTIRTFAEYKQKIPEYHGTADSRGEKPVRNLLADRLEQAILLACRHEKQLGVLFLDLDNFKFINDSLGHGMGDQVLKAIAGRLKSATRSSDTVSRQAGDEFVIVILDVTEPENAATVAGKVIKAVSKTLVLENHDLSVTCSIGISVYPRDGENAQDLLKNADAALYRAKEQGKNVFQFFRPK